MNDNILENKDTIFLSKIQLLFNTIKELELLASTNPEEQRLIDHEISDYLHLIQNNDLSDEKLLDITKKLKIARIKRNALNNVNDLANTWFGNNKTFIFSDHRYKLENAIKEKLESLNCEYKFRVLDKETVESYKEATVIECKVRKTRGKYDITKKELEEKLASGMKNKQIAEELGCEQSYISVLKKKYGLGMREYNRRGE